MVDAAKPQLAASATGVWTRPLVVAWCLVLTIVLGSWWSRTPRLDLPGTLRLLADGDLDGAERSAQQERLLALAAAAPADDLTAAWARCLAAVALGRPAEHAAALQLLGGDPPKRFPPREMQELLAMGDPLLANLLRALVAAGQGDAPAAAQAFQQVHHQSRLMGRPFAAELAAAALKPK
jgi:hypothetical protein